MQILITGHCGYIGSHLVRSLADQHQIDGADLRDSKRHLDIRWDALPFPEGMRPHDGVIHLAALASVPESVRRPLPCWGVNVTGTAALLGTLACRSFRGRFILASSLVARHPESSPYAATKFACESMVTAAAAAHGFSAVILRLGNVCGGGDPTPGRLIPSAVRAARDGTTLNVMGDCTRDYIHVEDVVGAIGQALTVDLEPGCTLRVDVGTGRGTHTSAAVEVVRYVSGKEVPIRWGDPREGDTRACVADTAPALAWLGWVAKQSLIECVKDEWSLCEAQTIP